MKIIIFDTYGLKKFESMKTPVLNFDLGNCTNITSLDVLYMRLHPSVF